MASVTVVLSGDDARLNAAYERLFQQQQKALDNFDKSIKKSKEDNEAAKAAAEAQAKLTEAHRRAAAVIKANETAAERYNRELKELNDLHKMGALSADQLARAEARLKDEFDKVNAKIAQANAKLEESNAKQKDANATLETKNGLLDSAVTKIGEYATGVGLATAGAAALKSLWEQIVKNQQAGAKALQDTLPKDRNLLQVSDNAEQFRQLRSQSDSLAIQFGANRNEVRQVMFQGVSEGFKDSVPEIVRANQVIPMEEAASVAGQVPALFQGSLSAMEAVNLTLRAAKDSRLDFAPMARAIPQAAEGGAIAKASPEETLATLSVLASRFKSGDVAADRIKAFSVMAGIDQSGELKGLGIVGAVKKLQAMTEEDRNEYLKSSQELNVAYNVMVEELPKIEAQLKGLQDERKSFNQGSGILREQIGIAENDPEFRAQRLKAIADAQKEVVDKNINGIIGTNAETSKAQAEAALVASNNIVAQMLNNGPTLPVIGQVPGLSSFIPQAMSQVGFSPGASAGFASGLSQGVTSGITGGQFYNPPSPDVEAANKMLEAAKLQLKAAEKNANIEVTVRQPQASISAAARSQAATAN